MKKGFVIAFVVLVFLISLVSAYYYGGRFSLSDLLNEIDSDTMLLGATFIISFALLNLSLSNVFKDNKAIPGIISFVLALSITWGINKSGFDFEGFFYGVGISEDFLFAILPLLILGAFIYAVIKWKGSGFIYMGIIFIAFGFTGLLYEYQAAIFIGIILIGIGWGVNKMFPSKKKSSST